MSKTIVYKIFQFEAAHRLPYVDANHKCYRLHGHSFKVKISVANSIQTQGKNKGMVIDFADIKKYFKPIYKQLDHHYLNDIEGLDNPTSENIAHWIWHKLSAKLPNLYEVEVMETCNSGCIYRNKNK